jgi:hypothetical protein
MSTHPPLLDRVNRLRSLTGMPALDAIQTEALAALD